MTNKKNGKDDLVIGITMGDPASVGPEITLKTLIKKEIREGIKIVVIGSIKRLKEAGDILGYNFKINDIQNGYDPSFSTINVYNIDLPYTQEWGKLTPENGLCAITYVDTGIQLLKENKIQAIVTNAVHKKAIQYHREHFAGHTGYIGEHFGNPNPMMVLIADQLRVAHVTTHIPFKDVPQAITKEKIVSRLTTMFNSSYLLGKPHPRVAVAALNPHAGDNGLFGDEEIKVINPAIDQFNEQYKPVHPVEHCKPADSVFSQGFGGKYDFILAMYHDQGHTPVKLLGFHWDKNIDEWGKILGVNVTFGLPIIRTSVDHGVAFGKAGKGTSSPDSLIKAVEIAKLMIKNGNNKKESD